ncbi:hypothetical protein CK203_099616 [Vitis vinifera]|uniref:Uncharacterized protein n=1 Tax=Vitis vinifera TaxID=29760 RepID=A0A438E908_VITVI|nr:hypothetical protein CK203_099616 [Vitis vinifera]
MAASQSTPLLDSWHIQPSAWMCTWNDTWHVQPFIRTTMGLVCDTHLPWQDVLSGLNVEEASTSGNCSGSGNSNPQHWRRLWELALAKMSTPSRSRSSAMGDEGHFDWRKTMERLQLESERQMQSLLQEIRRLREENDVLQI